MIFSKFENENGELVYGWKSTYGDKELIYEYIEKQFKRKFEPLYFTEVFEPIISKLDILPSFTNGKKHNEGIKKGIKKLIEELDKKGIIKTNERKKYLYFYTTYLTFENELSFLYEDEIDNIEKQNSDYKLKLNSTNHNNQTHLWQFLNRKTKKDFDSIKRETKKLEDGYKSGYDCGYTGTSTA